MNKLLSTAILLAGMALATNASAATFTSDHCSGTGGCGGNGTAFATITGTQVNANTVDILITPLNGNLIIGSGLTTFTFNLTTNVDVTYSNLTLANQNPGFSVVNGFNIGLQATCRSMPELGPRPSTTMASVTSSMASTLHLTAGATALLVRSRSDHRYWSHARRLCRKVHKWRCCGVLRPRHPQQSYRQHRTGRLLHRPANPVRRPHPGTARPVRGRLGRHQHAAARYQEAHSGRRSRSELTKEIRSPSRQMATVASPVPLARGSVVSALPLPPATFTSTKLDTARSKTDRATLAKDQPRSAGSCSCWAVHFSPATSG